MQTLEQLTASVPESETILAVGLARQFPVVVTRERLLIAGSTATVSIPFSSVTNWEFWHETHRWELRLIHEPIDPRRPADEARQWWRWHDRRKLRRLWRETTLRFSSDHTAAAEALKTRLEELAIPGRDLGSQPSRGSGGSSEWLVRE